MSKYDAVNAYEEDVTVPITFEAVTNDAVNANEDVIAWEEEIENEALIAKLDETAFNT